MNALKLIMLSMLILPVFMARAFGDSPKADAMKEYVKASLEGDPVKTRKLRGDLLFGEGALSPADFKDKEIQKMLPAEVLPESGEEEFWLLRELSAMVVMLDLAQKHADFESYASYVWRGSVGRNALLGRLSADKSEEKAGLLLMCLEWEEDPGRSLLLLQALEKIFAKSRQDLSLNALWLGKIHSFSSSNQMSQSVNLLLKMLHVSDGQSELLNANLLRAQNRVNGPIAALLFSHRMKSEPEKTRTELLKTAESDDADLRSAALTALISKDDSALADEMKARLESGSPGEKRVAVWYLWLKGDREVLLEPMRGWLQSDDPLMRDASANAVIHGGSHLHLLVEQFSKCSFDLRQKLILKLAADLNQEQLKSLLEKIQSEGSFREFQAFVLAVSSGWEYPSQRLPLFPLPSLPLKSKDWLLVSTDQHSGLGALTDGQEETGPLYRREGKGQFQVNLPETRLLTGIELVCENSFPLRLQVSVDGFTFDDLGQVECLPRQKRDSAQIQRLRHACGREAKYIRFIFDTGAVAKIRELRMEALPADCDISGLRTCWAEEALELFASADKVIPLYVEGMKRIKNELSEPFANSALNYVIDDPNAKQLQAAAESFEQALALCPKSSLFKFRLALCRMGIGKWKESSACLDEILARYPSCLEAEVQYGWLEKRRWESDGDDDSMNRAVARFQSALAKDTDNTNLIQEVSGFAYRGGQVEKFLPFIERGLEVAPHDDALLTMRAIVALNRRELETAERILLGLWESKPNDDNAPYNLACLYSIQKKKKQALKFLALSIEKGYTNWEHMEEDGDLESIRGEAEFKAMMEKLKK